MERDHALAVKDRGWHDDGPSALPHPVVGTVGWWHSFGLVVDGQMI